jgi:hypothetical protein
MQYPWSDTVAAGFSLTLKGRYSRFNCRETPALHGYGSLTSSGRGRLFGKREMILESLEK